jgi:hypothetical protein
MKRNGRSSCRQSKRQYDQPSKQQARYKRKHRLLRVRVEVAASLCSPGHRGPHGSDLLADTIIYPKVVTHPTACPFLALKSPTKSGFLASNARKTSDPDLMRNARPDTRKVRDLIPIELARTEV